jgi:hypothetical protein
MISSRSLECAIHEYAFHGIHWDTRWKGRRRTSSKNQNVIGTQPERRVFTRCCDMINLFDGITKREMDFVVIVPGPWLHVLLVITSMGEELGEANPVVSHYRRME